MTLSDAVRGCKVELTACACKKSEEKITLQMVVSGLVAGVVSPITAVAMVPATQDKHSVGTCIATGMIWILTTVKPQ